MNELTVFKHDVFGEVRIIDQNGDAWFVAKDVADVLEYSDTQAMTRRLDDDEKDKIKSDKLSGLNQSNDLAIINESGLYNAIIGSHKPEAKVFKKWVTSVVLPQIRKTGAYMPKSLPEALRAYADALEREEQLKIENQIMLPKAEYFDKLVDRKLLTNFRDTAKEFKLNPSKFTKYLLDNNYVYKDVKSKVKPYMKYVPDLFEIKEWTKEHHSGRSISGTQTLITPKGRETFRMLLQ